jgi:dihydroorotase
LNGRNGTPAELVIRNAHLLDPSKGRDGVADVRIREGRVAEIGEGLRGTRELDADGLHLFPGFVDVHAHWRTPAQHGSRRGQAGRR